MTMDLAELERSLHRLAGPEPSAPRIDLIRRRARRRNRRQAGWRTAGVVVVASTLAFAIGQAMEARTAPPAAPVASDRLPEPAVDLFGQLVDAVRRDDAATVAILIQSGVDPHRAVGDGITPLMIAAFRGDVDSVEVLLDSTDAGDVDRVNDFDATALRLAAQQGHVAVVGQLIEAGAVVDRLSDEAGAVTPLMEAARFGQPAVVEALLESGADPHLADGRGRPTVLYALDSAVSDEVVDVFRRIGFVLEHPDGDPARSIVFADRSIDDLLGALRRLDVPAPVGSGDGLPA